MDSRLKILDTAMNIIAPGNRFTISKMVEEAITDVLINKYGSDWETKEEVFENCYDSLRKRFNVGSYVGDIPYFYSMYYMPLNIPKIQTVLIQLMRRKNISRTLNVLDIGSGVGTVTFALVDLFSLLDNLCEINSAESFFNKISISSIEGSADNIKVYNENKSYYYARLSEFASSAKFELNTPQYADATQLNIEGSYDLIILSNFLNEIPYSNRVTLLNYLESKLTADGDIILIEPASQKASKDLNRLKKEVVDGTSLGCIGPCGACEKCSDCWSFQTCDLCKCNLISYVDKIYAKTEQTKYTEYQNNRLKWGYVILSNNCPPDSCSDISKAYANSESRIQANVVDVGEGYYYVCDGKNHKARLEGRDTELGYFHFGDCICLDNIVIKKSEGYTIEYSQESTAYRFHANLSKEKIVFPNAKPENLRYMLKRLWGFDDFREGQMEIIQKALKGDDILGILSTGAGKSICYQLPAMLGNGVSLIVSPLKSLIKDQITNLRDIGFEFVDYIDSSKSGVEKDITLRRLKSGRVKLLYLAPERLQMRAFQIELKQMLKNFSIDYFIIDEAHCASEWGHDFRPSYLKLRDIVTSLGSASIIAVTATASIRVKEDILSIFNIKAENVINSYSLDRPEISLQVVLLPNIEGKDKYLTKVLERDLPEIFHEDTIDEINEEGAGIVFTIYANPKGVSTIPYGTNHALEIAQNSQIESKLYHSQLMDSEREAVQDSFKNNEFPLLVSTKGFGMGIDKPNIRYIIHMCYSNSLEAYYQEAGRAGRDREHAHSVIIARARQKECVENTINNYEPPCVGQWFCHYTHGIRCDYGMQAKFISDAYPDSDKTRESVKQYYNSLITTSRGRDIFTIFSKEANTKKEQTYLFYFQRENVILNYATSRYLNGGMEFIVKVDQSIFNKIQMEPIIENIIVRLQNFKKQKYNMLESMWEYVSNTTKCRRQMLMEYLNDEVSYGSEGCRFCDIDGISEESSIAATRSKKIKKMFDDYQTLMKSEKFNYGKAKALLQKMYKENQQESAKIRAMKYLEDYPDSPVALYFRSIITLKRNQRDAYSLNQCISLVNLLISGNEVHIACEVVGDLLEIDEEVAEQVLSTINIDNADTANQIIKKINREPFQETISKALIKSRVLSLNKQLARRLK